MAPVQFQILTDLHLETHPSLTTLSSSNPPPTSPCLATLATPETIAFFAFLEKQVKRYWAVFFLIGNHEPYHLTLPAAKARLRAFAERWNVCVLSQLLGNSFSFP